MADREDSQLLAEGASGRKPKGNRLCHSFSLAILALLKKKEKNKAQASSDINLRWPIVTTTFKIYPSPDADSWAQTCPGLNINMSGPIRTSELRLKVT